MALCEADLPLAIPHRQRTLDLGALDAEDATALSQNLSALAARDGRLWLGGDEGRSLYRLKKLGDGLYGEASSVKLKAFNLAGPKEEGESDIEGLARDGQRLWLVGSHSLRRRKHDTTEDIPLTLHKKQSRNVHVLGFLRLDGEGEPVAGQRLAFDPTLGNDALTRALAADPRLQPFLSIPSKENGLDIEGLAARDDQVLVGLRGPVLRGIALVVDLRLEGFEAADGPLSLASHRLRFLDLRGLAVRDLAVVPGGDDVLILAGPTMTQAGPSYLYRWRGALSHGAQPQTGDGPAAITVEEPEPLLWIRDSRPGRPSDNPAQPAGSDKPEGLEVQRHDEDGLVAWVAYDDPLAARRQGQGVCTRLDGFAVPD
jgi:hypothetical protein